MSNEGKISDRYTYRVYYSEEDESYIGLCAEFSSISGFGESPEEALTEVRSVVESAVEWLSEDNETIPEPISAREYKGKISLRIPPETHRRIAILAAEAGVSVNQFITSTLERDSGESQVSNKLEQIETDMTSLWNSIQRFQEMVTDLLFTNNSLFRQFLGVYALTPNSDTGDDSLLANTWDNQGNFATIGPYAKSIIGSNQVFIGDRIVAYAEDS